MGLDPFCINLQCSIFEEFPVKTVVYCIFGDNQLAHSLDSFDLNELLSIFIEKHLDAFLNQSFSAC